MIPPAFGVFEEPRTITHGELLHLDFALVIHISFDKRCVLKVPPRGDGVKRIADCVAQVSSYTTIGALWYAPKCTAWV